MHVCVCACMYVFLHAMKLLSKSFIIFQSFVNTSLSEIQTLLRILPSNVVIYTCWHCLCMVLMCCMLHQSHLFNFITISISDKQYKLRSSSLYNPLQSPFSSSLLCPNIPLSTLFSNALYSFNNRKNFTEIE